MPKVLIITYYWPPSGGGGVQRWVKMAKYFEGFGWEPVIFKPANPEYPIIDDSFTQEVAHLKTITGKIWEPARLLKKLGAKKEANLSSGFVTENTSWKQKLVIAIRGNFFIPDARKFWIKPSIKTLSNYLKTNAVDAIISTGPPHSAHLIALGLKEKFQLPWVADFRDPWTNIDFYEDLHLTSWADKKHHRLERRVLQGADLTVSIGKTMGTELLQLGANKVKVITNGYEQLNSSNELDKSFTLTHIGRLGKARNPHLLWKALQEIIQENETFKQACQVQLIGNVDGAVKQAVKENGLEEFVRYQTNVSNETSLKIQSKSQVLLLLINDTPNAKGILTGKFFEYLSVQRPIVALGPLDGDAAELLGNAKAGKMFGKEKLAALKVHVLELFEAYQKNELSVQSEGIEQYSRKNLAKEYVNTLNELLR